MKAGQKEQAMKYGMRTGPNTDLQSGCCSAIVSKEREI
jgi:hypothetical protein